MTRFEVGDIVRIVVPGSRETNGEARLTPAIVLGQYPDGSLALYCMHFQGSPLLANGVRPDMVDIGLNRHEILRRLDQLEKDVAALAAQRRLEPRVELTQ